MSDRKTITLRESAYDALDDAKREDESFSDTVERLADGSEGEHTPNTVAVTNVDEIARRTADEVENRMTRR